jgi:hypothetical protein
MTIGKRRIAVCFFLKILFFYFYKINFFDLSGDEDYKEIRN